jgi:nucleotide-binding universal stress UspA family protein
LPQTFSAASYNALKYSVGLARLVGGKVILFHAYQTVNYVSDMVLMVPDENLRMESEDLLQKQVESLAPSEREFVQTVCELGSATETIIAAAERLKVSWIIAGMKGSGRTFRKLFGSVAITLSKQSPVPVIIVPETVSFKYPASIALASDLNADENFDMLDPLVSFAQTFQSQMYIVRVLNKGSNEFVARGSVPFTLRWHVRQLHPSFEFVKDDDVIHALNQFVSDHQIDLVAMIAHEHTILERIFIKSHIKEMLFEANVPLMILPDKVDMAVVKQLYETTTAVE